MQIEVKGRNVPVSDELREYVTRRFDKVGKQVSELAVLQVEVFEERNPANPDSQVAEATLRSHEGYYHGANPRNQAAAFLEWLLSGETISAKGDRLSADPVFGPPRDLIPVSATLFRFDTDPGAIITVDAAMGGIHDGRFLFFVQDGKVNGGYSGALTDPLMLEGTTP